MPIENPTTYIEKDDNNHIETDATRASFNGITRNEDARLHKDLSATPFDGDNDFEILFAGKATSGGSTTACYGAVLCNIVDDIKGIIDASGDLLSVSFGKTAVGRLDQGLVEYDGGVGYIDLDRYVENTQYYYKYKYVGAIGAFGTLYLYRYTDEEMTALDHLFSIALHSSKKDYDIFMMINTFNDGNTNGLTGYFENYDLQRFAGNTNLLLAGVG